MDRATHALQAALSHQRAGRFAQAEAAYRQILARHPNNVDALHLLGTIAQHFNQHLAAVAPFERSLSLDPNHPAALTHLGLSLQSLGRPHDAAAAFKRAIEIQPNSVEAHKHLANLQADLNQHELALASYRRAMQLQPDAPDVLHNAALSLLALGQNEQARPLLERSLKIDPHSAATHNALAMLLHASEPLAAERHFRRAIALQPDWATPHTNLGNVLDLQGDLQSALDEHAAAVFLDSQYALAYHNLGQTALAADLPRALEAHRRSVALNPLSPSTRSGMLLALNYDPDALPTDVFTEHLRWDEIHGRPLSNILPPIDCDRIRREQANRPLRVGYVSYDFREHAVAYFSEPVIAAHDPQFVESFCYACSTQADHVTAHIKSTAHQWRDVAGMNDDQLARQIRGDRIDILVDLSGHTGGNRLLVFAQAHAAANHLDRLPQHHGAARIDVWLSDSHLNPGSGDTDALASEQIVRLPDTFVCYRPPDAAPPVNALPALTNRGRITFASFHALAKLNGSVLDAWSALMREMPGSRLLLTAGRAAMRRRCAASPIVLHRAESTHRGWNCSPRPRSRNT